MVELVPPSEEPQVNSSANPGEIAAHLLKPQVKTLTF